MFFVMSGVLKVVKQQKMVVLLREGDSIGEISMMVNEPRPTDVISLQHSSLLVLPKKELQTLLRMYPKLANEMEAIVNEHNALSGPATGKLKRLMDMGGQENVNETHIRTRGRTDTFHMSHNQIRRTKSMNGIQSKPSRGGSRNIPTDDAPSSRWSSAMELYRNSVGSGRASKR